jgi:two-component system, OmpR family, response regulator CpxR
MRPNTSPGWRKADLRDSSRQTLSSRKRDNKAVSAFSPSAPIPLSPLLLIDDDRSLASLISEYCAAGGFSITSALSGEDGLRMARQQFFMLIILDVMLPGIDGFEVLKHLRETSRIPILMLTTRGAAMDRVHGLESGADDYLAKPFQPEELVARIKTILRRVYPKDDAAKLIFGDVTVDELERSVLLSDERIEVTGAEFHLLRLLLSNPGDPMSREELIPCIFGREATAFDRSIDNLVNNLRRKLGPHADGADRIRSVRNIGYCYAIRNDGTGTS